MKECILEAAEEARQREGTLEGLLEGPEQHIPCPAVWWAGSLPTHLLITNPYTLLVRDGVLITATCLGLQ